MSAGLYFEVLGPVRARRDGIELALGSPRQRAVLALLLLRGGLPAAPDELIDAIWGGSAPRAAIGMVRSYISQLRQVLAPAGQPAVLVETPVIGTLATGAPVIESVPGGYALPAAAGVLDLTVFQRSLAAGREAHRARDAAAEARALREALSLWQGTALAGASGDFVQNERTRLGQLRLAALEDRLAADLELGRHLEMAAELTALVGAEPLRERPRELLMLALYRSARQNEALTVFLQGRRILTEQLGLEPGPGLRDMQRRILAADPELIRVAAQPSPVASAVALPAARQVLAQQPADCAQPLLEGTERSSDSTQGSLDGTQRSSNGARPLDRARPTVRPAQLPPDLPDFTGRTDLIPDLVRMLSRSPATVPVVGLVGIGGIGKTTLAVHAGHAMAEAFPDGQFFVELGSGGQAPPGPAAGQAPPGAAAGRALPGPAAGQAPPGAAAGQAPPGPAEALAGLLRAVGVEDAALPGSLRERAALWRTLTDGRRLLLVLDDVSDPEQVRQLLPGSPGSAVLITGRQRFLELPGVRWLKLAELTEAEALDLLESVIGDDRARAEPAVALEMVNACGGLPSAVRFLGARIAARPGWSLAAATTQLMDRDPGSIVNSRPDCLLIEQPYEVALRQLPPQVARAFRLGAVAEGPDLPLAAAAAALDLPAAEAQLLFEALADVHLVESLAPGRYLYHGPVRFFGRRRALLDDGADEYQAVLNRLADRRQASASGDRRIAPAGDRTSQDRTGQDRTSQDRTSRDQPGSARVSR